MVDMADTGVVLLGMVGCKVKMSWRFVMVKIRDVGVGGRVLTKERKSFTAALE